MKYNYTIDSNSKLSIEVYSGIHTLEEFARSRSVLYVDEDYNPTFDTLSDFNDATIEYPLNIHPEYLTELKRKHLIRERKVALIAHNPNQFAYATQMKKCGNETQFEFEVFTNLKSALEWLGRSEFLIEVKESINRQKEEIKQK